MARITAFLDRAIAKLRRPVQRLARRFEPGCDFRSDRISLQPAFWMLFIRYQANGEKEN